MLLVQFVNFTEVMASCGADVAKREAQFAMRALMEIPEQYKVRPAAVLPLTRHLHTTAHTRAQHT